MEAHIDLTAGFAEVSRQQWIEQSIKDLKGTAFSTLEHTTPDGIAISPFYTAEDIIPTTPLFTHTDWEVCETVAVHDEEIANRYALDYLNNGATAIIFKVFSALNFEELLKDIGIEYIAVHFQIYAHPENFTAGLDAYLGQRNLDKASLNITLDFDPIASLVSTGKWPSVADEDLAAHTALIEANPGCRNLCINGGIYHEAGATTAYELACILAHATEYLNRTADKKHGISIQLNIAIGADYFTEIAKHRALRNVFALLLEQYDRDNNIYIHSTTAERSLTIYDHYNNLLRTTTAAMAAVAGGCNSLSVTPYNSTYKQPDEFSERMARNIQLILKGESYFDKVSDVAAGAYYIESLTENLAQKAWAYFQEIEAAGGFIASLERGIIQQKISASAAQEQALFDQGKAVSVGTNKFPSADQQMKDLLELDIIPEPLPAATIKPLTASRLSAALELERFNLETLNA